MLVAAQSGMQAAVGNGLVQQGKGRRCYDAAGQQPSAADALVLRPLVA
jgi:hypothetical protein